MSKTSRKYYYQIPNLIDDTEMSVHAFRLYCHIKRVAGDNGKCYQNTKTLAAACNMGAGSVSRGKKELLKLKLITISHKPTKHGGKKYHDISIVDIWDKNLKRYSGSTEGIYIDYDEYIRSPEWKQKAADAKKRARYKCQLCNADGSLSAHHRTYERLGNERPEDITVLCTDKCHPIFHNIIL